MLHCDYAPISDVVSLLLSKPQRYIIDLSSLIRLHKADLSICLRTGTRLPDCWDVSSNKSVGLVHALDLLASQTRSSIR